MTMRSFHANLVIATFLSSTPWILQAADDDASPVSISFAQEVEISANTSDGAASSEAADFDQDGRLEFFSAATSSTTDPHFRIYDYQESNGEFLIIDILPSSEVGSRLDRFGGDLTTADLNNDGWDDIIVPSSRNSSGPGELSWFENPDGALTETWTEHVISTWSGSGTGNVVAHMSEVVVGDLNGDGLLDVLTRDISHGVYLLLQESGTPDVTWQPRHFIPTRSREGLDLFNPDGDNDLDIILNGVWLETPTNPLTEEYTVHTYGANWYPAGSSGDEVRDYAVQLAVRDFNDDGRDDIAISNSEELNNASSTDSKPKGIRVYLAPNDPKTEPWSEITLESEHFSWHSLEPADLDFDGDMDLVSAISDVGRDTAPKQVAYFLNDGTGTTWQKVIVDTGSRVYNATLADADGDGDDDLFAPAHFNAGAMNYYQNTTLDCPDTPPPGSTNDTEALLLAHWTFDNTNLDVVSGREATVLNTDYRTEGQIGNALTFDEATDRAEVASFNVASNQLTLMCWVYPTSFAGVANEARFISKATGTAANEHIWMLGNIGDGTALRFRLRTDGSNTATLASPGGQLALNQWNHVAATYDGSSMKLFLNGNQVASQLKTGNITASPASIGLGGQPSGAGDRSLLGHLDEVRIYGSALSSAAIKKAMGTPLDQWAFTFGFPAGSALDGDSDNDGLPFLLEYAFDLDPTQDSASPITIDGCTFTFPTPRAELIYQPLYSNNLEDWQFEDPGGDRVFMRIEITQP